MPNLNQRLPKIERKLRELIDKWECIIRLEKKRPLLSREYVKGIKEVISDVIKVYDDI